MKAIKNKVVRMFTQIKNIVMSMFIRSQLALSNNSGEGFVDSGVKILFRSNLTTHPKEQTGSLLLQVV